MSTERFSLKNIHHGLRPEDNEGHRCFSLFLSERFLAVPQKKLREENLSLQEILKMLQKTGLEETRENMVGLRERHIPVKYHPWVGIAWWSIDGCCWHYTQPSEIQEEPDNGIDYV